MTWKRVLKTNFTSIEALAAFLELGPSLRAKLLAQTRFPLNVPRRLAEKMVKNRLDDPILRQFVPLEDEAREVAGFSLDPVQDEAFRKAPKLLQKYRGRALLLATSACAMHCRFCFRQNFPYETEVRGFEAELAAVRGDASLHEVILSGGDPLSLPDRVLGELFEALEAIPHVRRIRFHTRFPIGIPERIDEGFLEVLRRSTKALFFMLHCNHARECDADVVEAMGKLRRLGIPILSQSVLLKGVNDAPEVLLELYETLINAQIMPYSLNVLDRVAGTAHYAVDEARALELIRFVQENLSGFGVPRLVREEPGQPSKTWVTAKTGASDPSASP